MSFGQLFKNHFDDPTFSDLTLTLSDRSVKVHRVVLCRKSEYFTKLLTGGFRTKETSLKGIELKEDDPVAMLALIRYIYDMNYDYDGHNWWIDTLSPHAKVFATAEKYNMGGLQSEVCCKMADMLGDRFTHVGVRNPDDFIQTLRIIMTRTSRTNRLRELMVKTCVMNLRKLQKEEEFILFLSQFGELGADIFAQKDLECGLVGSWFCKFNCDNEEPPQCSNCSRPFEKAAAWSQRYGERWYCAHCELDDLTPLCSTCDKEVQWMQRGIDS